MSASATKFALERGSFLPETVPAELAPGLKISQENIQEAEQLLSRMNAHSLLKLKRLLRTKGHAIKKDIDLLEHNENTLVDLAVRLQEEKDNLERDKQKLSDTLAMMRDNLCKVADFNCKLFELRGEAVIDDSVKDQWTEKSEMLQKMEDLVRKGIEEDLKISKQFEESEKEWKKMMLDYMDYEEQIVTAHSRLEDLKVQTKNYEDLVEKQQSQLDELSSKPDADGTNVSRHAANIVLLRRKVTEPLADDYKPEAVQKLLDAFNEYIAATDEEMLEVKALASQVEATDDIRQHALELILNQSDQPGHHGVDEAIWAEIVRCSIKASEAGLRAKTEDLKDLISFKEKVLLDQIKENEFLRQEAGLGLPDPSLSVPAEEELERTANVARKMDFW